MDIPSHASPLRVHWLVRLRWAAVAAQLASIIGVKYLLHAPFPAVPLALIVGALVVANLLLIRRLRSPEPVSDRAIAANLLLDSAALTALLVYTGGAMNPFTTVYLLQVALAAILVPRRWSLAVTVGSVLLFGALLLARPEAIHVWHSASMFLLHVRGMWVAFALTAGCLWLFIHRVTDSLRRREEELAAARLEAERSARLEALGVLAAGAAHELNTPLGTVAIVAAELSERLAGDPDARAQVDLVRAEIRRCKEILLRLRMRAPDRDERAPVTLAPWLRAVLDAWAETPDGARVPLDVAPEAAGVRASVHDEALRQALFNLLDNAKRATRGADGAVRVELARGADGGAVIAVCDRGEGIAPEHLPRLGEPFFTTREPGQGMGLGLFLVQSIAAQHGGRMRARREGDETRVAVSLPTA